MDKLDYLQRQNRQLREDVAQLKQIIKMNKIQIDILSSQLKNIGNNQKLMDVIFSYRQKEQKLQASVTQLKKQLSQLSTDNLMLRQMNEGQVMEMKNMESMHLAAVESLHATMKGMDEKMVKMEKNHKQYDTVSGFVFRNREIVVPHELAIEMKNKQYEWKDQISIMKVEVAAARKNQENLMIVNTVLRNKIISLQAQLAMPNRNMERILDKSLKKLMMYFVQVQRRIITGDDESQSDDQYKDPDLAAPQLEGIFPEKNLRPKKDCNVPHLDLLKARDIMMQSVQKIIEALAARNHLSDKEKVERLELQLEYTRRELSRNLIDLREEKYKRKKYEKIINEIQARNWFLVESNRNLEIKVKKYWNKLKSEREKLYGMGDNQETGKGLVDEEINLDQTLVIPAKYNHQVLPKQNMKTIMNPSTLISEHHIDYKIHLQIIAKQLQKNKKIQNIKNLRPIPQVQTDQDQDKQPKRIKRSTSNPLLYFNERRNTIMESEQVTEEVRDRLEQTCYNPGENIGFEDVLEDLDV